MPEGTAQFTPLPDSKPGQNNTTTNTIYGQPCIHNPIGLGLKKVGHFRRETTLFLIDYFYRNINYGHPASKWLPSNHPTSRCVPHNHIMFLKTHKTGGSTIVNILFRYGDSRNLTFALGPLVRGGDHLGWPQRFRLSSTLPFYRPLNILCSHTVFNKKPMNWLFPREISKYVTIIRNPVDNFESLFNYYHMGTSLGLGDDPVVSLEKFLERPSSAIINARNPMMFDLGLNQKYFQNYTAVTNYINFLNKEFDLVMIMDYFDESLILLKRLLCWEIDDILNVKVNERLDNEKASNLSDRVKENIKRWNKADVLLFTYFNATFWKKIEMEGSGFYEDLSAFREKRKKLQQMCFENGTGAVQEVFTGKIVKSYSTRNDLNSSFKFLCNRLIKNENSYLDELRKKRKEQLESAESETEQTRIDDSTSWEVAKDLQYVPVET